MSDNNKFDWVVSSQSKTEALVDWGDRWSAEPVIAWGGSPDGSVVPITLHGPIKNRHAICLPDGTVSFKGYRYDDTADFLKKNPH